MRVANGQTFYFWPMALASSRRLSLQERSPTMEKGQFWRRIAGRVVDDYDLNDTFGF
jgi:hypothetical protein